MCVCAVVCAVVVVVQRVKSEPLSPSFFITTRDQIPKRKSSSLGKRLRGQIVAAFAKPDRQPTAPSR